MKNVTNAPDDEDMKDLVTAVRAFSRSPADTLRLIDRKRAGKKEGGRGMRKTAPNE